VIACRPDRQAVWNSSLAPSADTIPAMQIVRSVVIDRHKRRA
jgi:hypothetical protein